MYTFFSSCSTLFVIAFYRYLEPLAWAMVLKAFNTIFLSSYVASLLRNLFMFPEYIALLLSDVMISAYLARSRQVRTF